MMSSVQLMGQSELSTVLITVLTSRDCTSTATWKLGLQTWLLMLVGLLARSTENHRTAAGGISVLFFAQLFYHKITVGKVQSYFRCNTKLLM